MRTLAAAFLFWFATLMRIISSFACHAVPAPRPKREVREFMSCPLLSRRLGRVPQTSHFPLLVAVVLLLPCLRLLICCFRCVARILPLFHYRTHAGSRCRPSACRTYVVTHCRLPPGTGIHMSKM